MTNRIWSLKTRLGYIVPSINSVNEADFYRHLPKGVSVHTAKMKLGEEQYQYGGDEQSLKSMTVRHLDRAVDLVSDPEIDIVIYGMHIRLLYNRCQIRREDRFAARGDSRGSGISTSASPRKAASSLDREPIWNATPYSPKITERARGYFEGAEFTVTDVSGLDIDVVGSGREVTSHGSVPSTTEYRRRLDLDGSAADGVIISCTNYSLLDAINTLESDIGKPVTTSNQAMLWVALRTVGVDYSDGELGHLFQRSRVTPLSASQFPIGDHTND